MLWRPRRKPLLLKQVPSETLDCLFYPTFLFQNVTHPLHRRSLKVVLYCIIWLWNRLLMSRSYIPSHNNVFKRLTFIWNITHRRHFGVKIVSLNYEKVSRISCIIKGQKRLTGHVHAMHTGIGAKLVSRGAEPIPRSHFK